MVPPMQPEATSDRRTVVTAAVLGAGGLTGLTACSSSSGSGTTLSRVTDNPSSAPSPTPSSTAQDDVVTGSASSSTTEAAASLVKLSDVPVGGAVAAQAPSGAIVVARPTAGTVVAFSAICTHQGCKVSPQGNRLDCPCHGSVFDAFTGKPVRGPAPAPLQSVPVKVSGQDVVAG